MNFTSNMLLEGYVSIWLITVATCCDRESWETVIFFKTAAFGIATAAFGIATATTWNGKSRSIEAYLVIYLVIYATDVEKELLCNLCPALI